MRCRKAEKQLALLVGGDLPKKKIADLMAHLDKCQFCAEELEQLKLSRELVGKLTENDMPDPLPEDFFSKILHTVADSSVERERFYKRVLWKPAMAFAGAALFILLAFGVTQDLLKSRRGFFALKGKASGQFSSVKPGEVVWSAKFAFIKNLIGPSPINEMEFPEEPGIYAILHKPDPINRPKVFAVNFIGENSELSSVRENLVTIGKAELLISRAGSRDSLYIVLYPIPGSGEEERRQLKDSLIDKYKPYIRGNGGI